MEGLKRSNLKEIVKAINVISKSKIYQFKSNKVKIVNQKILTKINEKLRKIKENTKIYENLRKIRKITKIIEK